MSNSLKKNIHFLSAGTKESEHSKKLLIANYGQSSVEAADILVVLGGDGAMLHAIQKYIHIKKPIFGMNKGSVGFLMNNYHQNELLKRIEDAEQVTIYPLKLEAQLINGQKVEALAINEVSVFRQSYQAAKICIKVDDKIRMHELICDGVMVSTPAGSTAYNLSASGPILPLSAPLMALTPISPFRPRRWHGALLSNEAKVEFEALEIKKRPVNAVADNIEIKSIRSVIVTTQTKLSANLLFDPDHSWEERIINEQFLH